MATLRMTTNADAFARRLDGWASRQIPFAMAQTLNQVVREAQVAETAALPQIFNKPTPFTQRAFTVTPARKTHLVAVVFAKDIQAAYLEPYGEHGSGRQDLRGRVGLGVPVDARVNQYGNLPRGKIKALLAQPDVFSGVVRLKDGQQISGIWQRGKRGMRRGALGRRSGEYGAKGSHNLKHNAAMGVTSRTTLKLLVRWSDGVPVHQRFGFQARARTLVERRMRTAFAANWTKALATAKR